LTPVEVARVHLALAKETLQNLRDVSKTPLLEILEAESLEPKTPEETEPISPAEYIHLIKACEIYAKYRQKAKDLGLARILETVNAVNYSAKTRVTKVRLHEDLIYLYLKTNDGQSLRGLLDTGATVSGIAERLLDDPKTSEWINKCENKARLHERDIIYANSKKGQTGRTFENVDVRKERGGERPHDRLCTRYLYRPAWTFCSAWTGSGAKILT